MANRLSSVALERTQTRANILRQLQDTVDNLVTAADGAVLQLTAAYAERTTQRQVRAESVLGTFAENILQQEEE